MNDRSVGHSILAYVPEGPAGAATLDVARALAETTDGWLTVAVSIDQPSWQSTCRAIGGCIAHPSEVERLAQVRLEDHLDALRPHVKTHGVILRGSLVRGLLRRAASARHDVIVVPASPRHRWLRSQLRARCAARVLVPNVADDRRIAAPEEQAKSRAPSGV
jgi:hypothetical protein